MEIRLFDVPTASALAQILPVLLLALILELRRTNLHKRGRSIRRTRILIGVFYGAFAIVETVLVLSIDGRLFPANIADIVAAIVIFALLWLLFAFSMMDEGRRERD
jgi:hypothetical protein